MTPCLEEYLVKKFPEFFVDYGKSPKESCMAWGCSCGDGWFLLINRLCQQIKSHIDSHNKSVEWYEEDEAKSIYKGNIPLERPEWAKEKINFKFTQIKEKFGFLRAYYSGGDEVIEGYIGFAESLSRYICENCGRFDTTVGSTTQDWIQSICVECASKDPSYTEKEWDVFKENDEIAKLFLQAMEYNQQIKGREIQVLMEKVEEISKR